MTGISKSTRIQRAADKACEVHELMPKIYFVEDFGADRYRVGRTDWPGDQFELISRKEFDAFRKIYESLNMPLLDLTYITHED